MENIQLESIAINGFKDIYKKIIVDFSDDKATVIYGKNGVGKTTLLNIIFALFNKDEEKLSNENVKSIFIKYKINGSIKSVSVEKNQNNYDWWQFEKSSLNKLNLLYLSTERGLSNYRRSLMIEDINIFFQHNNDININSNSSYQVFNKFLEFVNGRSSEMLMKDIFTKKNIFIQNINMSNLEKIVIEKEKYIKQYLFMSRAKKATEVLSASIDYLENLKGEFLYNNLKENRKINNSINLKKEELLYLEEILKEKYKSVYKIICYNANSNKRNDYINNLKKIIDYSLYEVNRKKLVIKYFNELTNKQIIINEEDVYIKTGEGVHSLEQLSHGERHLITFLILFSYIGIDKKFILIDEPDIALDTDWQSDMIRIFKKLCPRSQFLLTSHSPYMSIENQNCISDIERF